MERSYQKRSEENKGEASRSRAYIEKIKAFLTEFKTKPCTNQFPHEHSLCFFHHNLDKRRNPYGEDTFTYYPESEIPPHQERNENEQTFKCLNETELAYHPILYRTQQCINFYNCPNGLFCCKFHFQDRKHFDYGQYFRFDIVTHKTKPCPRREPHERKTCIYYHNDLDRRRPCFKEYSHELCPSSKKCVQKMTCPFSHNKIQQVYHPTRYKTKFCQSYPNKTASCDYKEFCAFAHFQSEIKIQMIHLEPRDHNFYIYKYKTVWCPDTQPHDRAQCPYAHNIQDFRRNPLEFKYKSEKCPNWNFDEELKSLEDSGCKAGMSCDKCHGWMEHRYHPQVYKKSKVNQSPVQNILDKKLNSQKQKANKRISILVEEKCLESKLSTQNQAQHVVGRPFFKSDLSESSRKTKAITANIESDDSCYTREEQAVIGSPNATQQQKLVNLRKNNMFLFAEDQIWRNQDENNEFQRKLNQERARSESKFNECETIYSHSLKETVGNSSILKKLKNNNINGVKIKNLSSQQIQKFVFLDYNEKQILSYKIRLYNLKREKNPILYSHDLSKFFIKKKKQHILQKTQSMKIKEEQLLNLPKQIQGYHLLTSEERRQLPLLIQEYKKFCNEKQFNQIDAEIRRFVVTGGETSIRREK